MIEKLMRAIATSVVIGLLSATAASSQETVKLGQIEALTGATATYGWMSAQGARLAVEEINATEDSRSPIRPTSLNSYKPIHAANREKQRFNSDR
jgi:hypothetical protein